jgi:hypothetical protein
LSRTLGSLFIVTGVSAGLIGVRGCASVYSTWHLLSLVDTFVVDIAFLAIPFSVLAAGVWLVNRRLTWAVALPIAIYSALLVYVFHPGPTQIVFLLLPLAGIGGLTVLAARWANLAAVGVAGCAMIAALEVPLAMRLLSANIHLRWQEEPLFASAFIISSASSLAGVIYGVWKRKSLPRKERSRRG